MSRSWQTIALILGALACAGGSAFTGYHYLGLVSEYRERNFHHLAAVTEAQRRIGEGEMRSAEGRAAIAALVDAAALEAIWCTGRLSPLEQRAFEAMGAGPALEVCRQDAQRATVARVLMEQAQAGEDVTIPLRAQLDAMQADSLAFHPYLNDIKAKVTDIVRGGTLFGLVLTGLLAGLLARSNTRLTARSLAGLEASERANRRFNTAVNSIGEGFALFSPDDVLIACNETFRTLSGARPEDVRPGMTMGEIWRDGAASGVYGDAAQADPDGFAAAQLAQFDAGGGRRTLELPGDRHLSLATSATPEGDRCRLWSEITDFVRAERRLAAHARELEAANAEIRERALQDPLTGLPNRRHLDERLAAALADPAGPACVIRIDLDRFKQVNDVLGHEAGDFVLRSVADILRRACSAADFPARVGGDEFVVLCAPGTALERAEAFARQLLRDILRPLDYAGKPCRFGASFGVAMQPETSTRADDLLSFADAALYVAKASGRGTVEVFTPALHSRIIEDRRLGDEFTEALETGQIVPFFQTQHRASDHAVCGLEVLARWRHPRRGTLAPDAYLGVARQLGLEGQLDAVVFDAALRATDRAAGRGLVVPRLSFNVSAGRVTDPGFLDAARRVRAARAGSVPQLAFELLESVSLEEMGTGFWMNIDALRDMGFDFEIDDFGSGHASITSVVRLAPDTLKIDRELIRPLGESPGAEVMVRAILEIARALDIRVIAEGVETDAQARLLGELGVDALQGFHFSRPMPEDALGAYLATRPIAGAA